MAATFDTLKYAKRLEQAGVPEGQVEIHAEALRSVLEEPIMARFDKIDDKLIKLERNVDSLEGRTKGRFTLLQWMVAFNLAFTVAVLWMLIRIL